ncbi:hypothetical protein DMH25_04970 [Streptomyces sp. WAC 01325]|nr:hypothetical protein DMH25_04970 [Streptomyces sp. WAC 01325]
MEWPISSRRSTLATCLLGALTIEITIYGWSTRAACLGGSCLDAVVCVPRWGVGVRWGKGNET